MGIDGFRYNRPPPIANAEKTGRLVLPLGIFLVGIICSGAHTNTQVCARCVALACSCTGTAAAECTLRGHVTVRLAIDLEGKQAKRWLACPKTHPRCDGTCVQIHVEDLLLMSININMFGSPKVGRLQRHLQTCWERNPPGGGYPEL